LSNVSQISGFQRLCLITCVVIFGLIVLGGVVRATDSGDACPDWPLCHGSLLPRADVNVLIEYSHRATASVAGGLILGIVVWAWRSYRNVPRILYPSILTLALVLFQAGLGGAAVLNDLAAEIVMVHLGTALIILALVALITITSFDQARPLSRPRVGAGAGRLGVAASLATMLLMLAGAYMAVAGYALACSGWPLCNGEVYPSASVTSVHVNWGHRFLALVTGFVVVGLVWTVSRHREEAPLAWRLALGALAVYGVQVMIGAINVWTEIATAASASHLAFGTLLWLTLALFNIRVHGIYEWLPRASGARARNDLATGATR
jgi:cytochrome c oxidase assembly protein subunit 15